MAWGGGHIAALSAWPPLPNKLRGKCKHTRNRLTVFKVKPRDDSEGAFRSHSSSVAVVQKAHFWGRELGALTLLHKAACGHPTPGELGGGLGVRVLVLTGLSSFPGKSEQTLGRILADSG